ncbi:MAG: anthranilate synthase component I [Oscillospiraceae bacterium]|nr:anthranilate synthase component I [Oscillospiraceae bacterium]
MLFPSLEKVKELAGKYTRIPVFFTFPADHRTPISIYEALSGQEETAFLLESINNGTQWDRYSFIGFHPVREIRAQGSSLQVIENHINNCENLTISEPFSKLQSILDAQTSPKFEDLPYFTGGMIGYFAYDSVRYTEKKLVKIPEDDTNMPDVHLFDYEELVAYDHLNSNAYIIVNLHADQNLQKQYIRAWHRAQEIAVKIENYDCHHETYPFEDTLQVRSNFTEEQFVSMVNTAKEYILSGDIFQVVLSQRFEIDNPPDSFEVYRRLRATNPSPYLYYFKTKDYQIAGASPELLVKVTDQTASTRPIAGTRPRGKTHEQDSELEKSLLADEKEKAEHTMLVDLGRNDLGRVSQFGTVKVTNFMYLERYSKVMHLVSDVKGKLRPDCKPIDALRSVLPAGTLSGAPKVRAMEIIDELENRKRGLYGGTVGYFGYNGDMNTCIAIRTVLFRNQKAYVQAGAGIVADSDPEKEFAETTHKASAMINAIREAENS